MCPETAAKAPDALVRGLSKSLARICCQHAAALSQLVIQRVCRAKGLCRVFDFPLRLTALAWAVCASKPGSGFQKAFIFSLRLFFQSRLREWKERC